MWAARWIRFVSEPIYRFADANNSEVLVYSDRVVFTARDPELGLDTTEILRPDLVAVMNRSAKELWEPDIVVVLHRDKIGALEYFVWALAEKNASRTISNEIYKIIDHAFWKSVVGFFYAITHPLKSLAP